MDAAVTLRIVALAVLAIAGAGVLWALRWKIKPETRERMPFLDHVEELRKRLLLGLGAWILGTVAAFSLRIEPGSTMGVVPAVQDNIAAQLFRIITDHLVPEGVQLIVTRPIDGFVAELYIAVAIGFSIALPILLWQVGRFLGPALEAPEKRTLAMAFLPALGLFAGGVTFCWMFVLPFLLETLYGYAAALGAQTLLSISELVGFTMTMLMVFGVSFQTPLLMAVLAKTGIVTARSYLHYWRHAVVAIIIFSALVTDPTVVSQVMVAGPLVILYFGGIVAARLVEPRD